ncbi:MAG: hypothetical protein VB086_07325 [Clostridiaceae bacterium]|nr:hypothetical protein [Clostridiaceae bacterium]
MEIKKRRTGLWVFLTALLALLLALAAWLATGPRSLTPGWFRYGFYPLTDATPSFGQPVESAMAGDGIITDRNAATKNAITYTYNGQEEAVHWRVFHIGQIVKWLETNTISVWAVCAALTAITVLLWGTARRRRIRRMQEVMKKNFQTYGARFEQEDEGVEY